MPVQMRTAADQAAVLSLFGDVGWEITPAGVAAELKKLSADQPITISINSYGGDALAGIAIHNMLARHAGPKTVIVEGIAASAASLIAMAGDRIVMPGNAFLMIHEAWGGALGDAETMRQQADVLDQISAAYRRTYAGKSGKTEEAVAALMSAETWFDAETAVAEGFASETAAPAEIRAFAAFDPNRYAAAPAAFRGLVRAASEPVPDAAPEVFNPPAIPPVIAEEIGMTDSVAQAGGNPPAHSAAPAQPVKASIADLRGIAERNGLGAEFALAQFEAGATREVALEAALEAVASRSPAPYAPARVLVDAAETRRHRMASAISARLSGNARAVPEDAREYMATGLHGMMREMLMAAGVSHAHRLDGNALYEAMRVQAAQHGVSDFPIILKDATNKTLQAAFAAFPATWQAWCQEVDVADFKTITSAQNGFMPDMQAVREGGEVKFGTIAEEGETYAVGTQGIVVALTRQAIINDDLNAFGRIIRGAAETGYRSLADTVYGILTTNGNMADGNALFSAAHANVGAGAAGSIYHYLVCPDRPTVEIAYLSGRRAPEITSQEGFDVLGISYRVIFDFGAKAVSWRGMTRDRNAVNVDGSTVGALEKVLLEMKAPGGARIAPPQRKVLLVPPSEHMNARRLATAITPDSASNVNIYGGDLQVIVEPRLG